MSESKGAAVKAVDNKHAAEKKPKAKADPNAPINEFTAMKRAKAVLDRVANPKARLRVLQYLQETYGDDIASAATPAAGAGVQA